MQRSGRLEVARPDHPASNAEQLIRSGHFREALAEIDELLATNPESTRFLRVKAEALMDLRRFGDAVEAIGRACALQPANRHYRRMHAIALKDAGRDAEALPILEILDQEDDADVGVLSALCVASFRTGREADALRYGQRKLDILVQAAPAAERHGIVEGQGERDVVSFSLWGDKRQYCEGALINARQVPELLPGWSARFYVDESVPESVIAQLRSLGAEVRTEQMDDVPRLMRRFLVHDDPAVRHYLVRDTDSRIGAREIAAVNDWIASGTRFHAMRDHPFHTELMMGGMWGGTAGRGLSMRDLIAAADDHRYGADQDFLGTHLWPRIREDLLTHDSYYSTPGSRPFPDGSRGTDRDHVGMGIVLRG